MIMFRLEHSPEMTGQRRVMAALASVLNDPQWVRRTERRLPYFGPVSVGLPDAPSVGHSAFARDLSPGGMGLVHLMPIAPGEVTITLALDNGRTLTLLAEILWCRDYDDGWYASGGRLIDVAS